MILSILSTLGLVLYVLLLLVGLLLVPLGFPGTWLMVVCAFVYTLIANFQPGQSDFWVLLFVLVLALIGEALEFGIGLIGAKRLAVSNGAIIASLIGGIVGTLVGVPVLLIGSVIGLLLGVFLGALIYELVAQRNIRSAFLGAIACFFSRVTAMFVKTGIAFGIVVYLLMKTF